MYMDRKKKKKISSAMQFLIKVVHFHYHQLGGQVTQAYLYKAK